MRKTHEGIYKTDSCGTIIFFRHPGTDVNKLAHRMSFMATNTSYPPQSEPQACYVPARMACMSQVMTEEEMEILPLGKNTQGT